MCSLHSCAVGDLTGKLGTVTVGVTMGTERKTAVDLNLPLSAASSVIGKSLQVFAPAQTTPMACAVISAFVPRTGQLRLTKQISHGDLARFLWSPHTPLDSVYL